MKPELTVMPGRYAVSRLEPTAETPAWVEGPGFVVLARTADELSIVCLEDRVPSGTRSQNGWRMFRVEGPFAFEEIGVLLPIAEALARADVSILAQSTFDTDYVMVPGDRLERARAALEDAGYRVNG